MKLLMYGILPFLLAGVLLFGAQAQPLNTDFRQAANKDAPFTLGNVHWIGSILQSSNSLYSEGMSVCQRIVFINVPSTGNNVHTLTFSHQASKSGHHAYDYLTSWSQALAAANTIAGPTVLVNLNQCGEEIHPPANLATICSTLHASGYTHLVSAPDLMGTVLGHSISTSVANYEFKFGDRQLKFYGNSPISGGTFGPVTYSGSGDLDAEYTLSWTSASTQIIIELAGHLSQGIDVPAVGPGVGYGSGLGSGSISGGPFHFMLHKLDGASLGQQDNQIMGGSILENTTCSIAGPDAVCGGSAGNTFNASSSLTSPTYSWSVTGGTIVGPSDASSVTVTAGTGASMTVAVSITGSNGSTSCSKIVTIDPPFTANAGSDQTVCSTAPDVTLAGAIGGGAATGTWSGGTGTFNPSNTTLNAVYTPSAAEIAAGTVTLTLTTNTPGTSCLAASDQMVITINPAATADAGPDQHVCETIPDVTLAGLVGGGASGGTWSGGGGIYAPDNTTLNAVYTPTAAEIAAGTVTLTLTTNTPSAPCQAVSDEMTITFDRKATADAGADQTVCSSSPDVTLAGSVGGTAISGSWSGGTGTFNPGNSTLNALYTPSAAEIAAGTVTLTLTTDDPAGPCGAVSDAMVITINPAATANAGEDQDVCETSPSVTLAGMVGGGANTGTWSGGTGGFNPDNGTLNAVYTPSAAEIAAGHVMLTLTTNDPSGPCPAVTDEMTITIYRKATVDAGADQTVCSSSPDVTLAGALGGTATTGTWSGGTGTFNPDNTTLNALYSPSAAEIAAGTVTLTLTTDDPAGPCGAVSDAMVITINPAATANAGEDQDVCETSPSVTLNGLYGGGASSAAWVGGNGTFAPSRNTLNAVYTPSADEIAARSVTLTLTTNDPDGPCGAVSDQMTIHIHQAAVAEAGDNQTVCSTDPVVTLNGWVGGGASSGTWSGGAGQFTYNNQTVQYHPSAGEIAAAGTPAGVITLTLTTDDPEGPCGSVSDQMTVTINPAATANAGPNQVSCADAQVQLAGSVGGGASSGSWVGGTGSFTPDRSALNAKYTPSAGEIAAHTVTLTLVTNDPEGPCGAVNSAMTITIYDQPVVNAGADQTVGECNLVQLNGSFNPAVSEVTWTTSGNGTFSNVHDPLALYTLSASDIAAGSVTLTLTSNDPEGPCGPVSDFMIVTIIKKPVCTLTAPSPLPGCGSSNNTFTGPTAPTGVTYSYQWILTSSDPTWVIVGSSSGKIVHYTAGSMGSSATMSLTVTDNFGCSGGCSVQMTLPVEHCTLTQGYYGNSGGTACKTGLGTLATIQGLLGTDLVIGRFDKGRSLTIKLADANCVILRLPGNATSAVLPSGNGYFTGTCGTTTNIPVQNNKFKNVLLGQTIALGLNLRLDPALGSQLLPAPAKPWLNAQNPTLVNTLCGDCGNGGDIANGGFVSYQIPLSVLNALGSTGTNKTVADLFALANTGLGGQSIGATTLSDITGAIDAINNGFDKCRFFVSYTAAPIVKSSPPEDEPIVAAKPESYELFDNYPNPFNPSTAIEFSLPEESRVTLTIYSLTGCRIAVLVDNMLPAGMQSIIWNAADASGRPLPSGLYTYALRAVSTSDGREFFKAKQMVLMK